IHTQKNLKRNACLKWNYFIYTAVTIGIGVIILNLYIYRDIIGEFTITGLNPNKPYTPKPFKHLCNLNLVFYLDLLILIFICIGFMGIINENKSK
ncbi:hypothetical protein, partial [Legionella sainthelensi]